MELNKSIEMGTGMPGSGFKFFEPYSFHADDPRKICVYTIPYLLDKLCPVLLELVDILWCSVSVITTSGDIGDGYMGRLQQLVDDFKKLSGANAEFIDVGVIITKFLEFRAESVCSNAEKVVTAKSELRDFFGKFVNKLKEYEKPDKVSDQAIALNLLLKLLFCIERGEYRSSTGFHNVFVMAYDTDADNRWFFTRWFGGRRSPMPTCVAFASVERLDPSTIEHESEFLAQYIRISDNLEMAIRRFLDYIGGHYGIARPPKMR